jgi:hypothetical protein
MGADGMNQVAKPRINDHWCPFNEVHFCRILANRAIIRRILHVKRNKGFYGVFRYRTENREEKRRLNWAILGLRGLDYSGILGKLYSGFSMVFGVIRLPDMR